MRKLIPMAVLSVACLFANKTMAYANGSTDSVKISHVTDGNISEWKTDKFETDKETQILYGIDHDANNLYVAMKITDQVTQIKMMRQGMSMFIDKKGKKKEGTGIEFPIKKEGGGMPGGMGRGGKAPGETAAPDPKAMRENLAAMMIFLRSFGFDDQEDKTQMIEQPGGINIAFDWDEANTLYIEYQVPLSFIGTQASLNGKPLSIGWKINGPASSSSFASTSSTTTSGPSSGASRGGGGGSSRNARIPQTTGSDFGQSNDSKFKEQNIWTKYVLTF